MSVKLFKFQIIRKQVWRQSFNVIIAKVDEFDVPQVHEKFPQKFHDFVVVKS